MRKHSQLPALCAVWSMSRPCTDSSCPALCHTRVLACRFALDHIPKQNATALYQRFVSFEKQHGDRAGIEDVIVSERRFQYEAEVNRAPSNYDTWFDYTRLEESAGDHARVREVCNFLDQDTGSHNS